jgi:hypothetical protein
MVIRTNSHLEFELERVYGDCYVYEATVQELQNELAGARFIIEDAVRTGKCGMAIEYLNRANPFDMVTS